MAKMRLYFREPDIDTNLPLVNGRVRIEGFETEIVRRLADADAWDCAFGGRMLDFEKGPRLVSIPAYPNRKFRLSYIFVNAAAGIEKPTDLHGKRVAIRYWGNTAGVWARGALMHHYGVDLSRIRWVSGNRDATPFPPGAINIEFPAEKGDASLDTDELDALLTSGEVDAVIDANVPPSITRRDARVRRLFQNYPQEEAAYYKATGIFPISHIVTLRAAFVERHPDAPLALLEAYRKARNIAFDDVEGSDPKVLVVPWIAHRLQEQRELMGASYFAYDVEHNRASLEAMMRFAHEQWLTTRQLRLDELFDAGAGSSQDTFQSS